MVDARILNTAAALNSAIVELASKQPISRITVSDVTREAGINRATFYAHYSSPSELLGRVLAIDLDEIRRVDALERHEGQRSPSLITRETLIEVARHVERYRDVYRLALTDATDGTTHRGLAAHFAVSCEVHLEHSVPADAIPGDPKLVAAFVANGLVGAIEAAVASDRWDENELADLLLAMMPVWWD